MAHIAPRVAGNAAARHRRAFRHVQRHLLGQDTLLELAHLGVLTTTTKGSRRFHVEITDLFNVSVDNGKAKLEQGLVAIFLVGLALFIGNGLANNLLFVQVTTNGLKVAFVKVLDDVLLAENGLEISKEILDKDLGRLGVACEIEKWLNTLDPRARHVHQLDAYQDAFPLDPWPQKRWPLLPRSATIPLLVRRRAF